MDTEKALIEKFGAYMKFSKVSIGLEADDFVKDLLTAEVYAKVASMAQEEGEITVYIERPTFLDWLFRRAKEKKIKYNIRQLAKIDKLKLEDNIRVIEFPSE